MTNPSDRAHRVWKQPTVLEALVAGVLVLGAWAVMGWCVVLARRLDWLPIEAVWTVFLSCGIALPMWIRNRSLPVDAELGDEGTSSQN